MSKDKDFNIMDDMHPFYDEDRQATFIYDDKNDSYCRELGSSEADVFIQNKHINLFGELIKDKVLKDMVNLTNFKTENGGSRDKVYNRVAKKGNTIYIDSADGWFVKITPKKVTIVRSVPVNFIINKNAKKLVKPNLTKKSFRVLQKYLKVSASQFRLILVFLFNCFFTDTHYVMLVFHGAAGSGKTFFTKVLQAIIDPSNSGLLDQFKNEEDLVVSTIYNYLITQNNISKMKETIQNKLCTVLTGGGSSRRKRWTDKGLSIIKTHNPVIYNTVEHVFTKEDLLQRSIVLLLSSISDSEEGTVSEKKLEAEFEADLPAILGAVYHALSEILSEFKTFTTTDRLMRMADFHELGLVTEKALGWKDGSFVAAYKANIEAGQADVLENSKVAKAILRMMKKSNSPFEGSCTKLGDQLEQYVDIGNITPRGLRGELNKINSALLNLHNIKITHLNRKNTSSWLRIECV